MRAGTNNPSVRILPQKKLIHTPSPVTYAGQHEYKHIYRTPTSLPCKYVGVSQSTASLKRMRRACLRRISQPICVLFNMNLPRKRKLHRKLLILRQKLFKNYMQPELHLTSLHQYFIGVLGFFFKIVNFNEKNILWGILIFLNTPPFFVFLYAITQAIKR